jgi:hypothetical protein
VLLNKDKHEQTADSKLLERLCGEDDFGGMSCRLGENTNFKNVELAMPALVESAVADGLVLAGDKARLTIKFKVRGGLERKEPLRSKNLRTAFSKSKVQKIK